MLIDACASCTQYGDGYAHWGMLKATQWFVDNELKAVRDICAANPGYGLLLVGHSLGAGERRGGRGGGGAGFFCLFAVVLLLCCRVWLARSVKLQSKLQL
jgi:hypothetical protein